MSIFAILSLVSGMQAAAFLAKDNSLGFFSAIGIAVILACVSNVSI
jgi:hypothetical protein